MTLHICVCVSRMYAGKRRDYIDAWQDLCITVHFRHVDQGVFSRSACACGLTLLALFHTWLYVPPYVCISIRVYIRKHSHKYTYLYVYLRMHMYMYKYTYQHIYIYIYVCEYAWMYIHDTGYMYICRFTLYMTHPDTSKVSQVQFFQGNSSIRTHTTYIFSSKEAKVAVNSKCKMYDHMHVFKKSRCICFWIVVIIFDWVTCNGIIGEKLITVDMHIICVYHTYA